MDTEHGRVGDADRAGGLRPEPAAQSQPEGTHPSRGDADLIEHAIRIARPKYRQRAPRWVAVMDTFALGRTAAIALCNRFGMDAEEVRVRR